MLPVRRAKKPNDRFSISELLQSGFVVYFCITESSYKIDLRGDNLLCRQDVFMFRPNFLAISAYLV
jgi:hypothetical protein